jgi:hypothetical protein
MPSESLHDTPPPEGDLSTGQKSDLPEQPDLPADLTQFSQRLASFGLGETPDPLLTESRPLGKRRPRRVNRNGQ